MTIKNMIIALALLASNSIAADKPVYSNPLAAPINKKVFPEEILAAHDTSGIRDLINGVSGIAWSPESGTDTIQFHFSYEDIKRFGIAVMSDSNTKTVNVPITFRYTSQWGQYRKVAAIQPGGKLNCFFSGSFGLPNNVGLMDLAIVLPPYVHITKLAFSDIISERKMVTCPMPALGKKIQTAYRNCISHPSDENLEETFVFLMSQSMHKYDCRRPIDGEPVPAWWLCDYHDVEGWLELLSHMKSDKAKMLFSSKLFRSTLDGEYAESYYNESMKVEKLMKKSEGKPGNNLK